MESFFVKDPQASNSKSDSDLESIFALMKEDLRSNLKEMKIKYSFDFEQDSPIANPKLIWLYGDSPKSSPKPCKLIQ